LVRNPHSSRHAPSANLGYGEVVMPKPVFVGDTLRSKTKVIEKCDSRSRPTAGLVVFEHRAPADGPKFGLRINPISSPHAAVDGSVSV
jgi:hypothetical protein